MTIMTTQQRETVRTILRDMAVRGRLTPANVVKEATKKDSPLHAYFEWDNGRAAHAYRLEQARELTRSCYVIVTIEERKVKVPEFVRDPSKATDEPGYVTLEQIRRDPEQARAHLHAELQSVIALLRRAEGYADILGITPELEKVQYGVRALAGKIAAEPLQ